MSKQEGNQGNQGREIPAGGTRGTDDAFYRLMLIGTEAVLKLLGVKDPGGYEAKAIVLKSKEVRPDVLALPGGCGREAKDRVYIEFQGYRSEMVRHLLAARVTLSCGQERYTGPVLAGIIFTDEEYRNAALPLELLSLDESFSIKGQFRELVLTDYSESELVAIDPRLITLAPFTVFRGVSKKELKDRGRRWVETAYAAYPKDFHQDVLNVLVLFLLNRFRDLSREEVIAMLDFDLAETRAGQEIFQEGIEKGKEKGKEEGLLEDAREMLLEAVDARFGLIPQDIVRAVKALEERETLHALHRKIFHCDNIDHFRVLLKEAKG